MIQTIILTILIGGMFMLVFGGAGIFMLNRYREARREAGESKNWPAVPGRITYSDISTLTPEREVDRTRTSSYAPDLEYAYTVQGTSYRSKRIGFGTVISSTHASAASFVERHPAGMAVTIYYNPQNPAAAVLQKKVGSQTGLLVLISITLLLGISACGLSVWAIVNSVIESH
ncbi:MAG TPA: DUF3592 domain-containing protein [Leptolinea sp.]